MKLAMWLQAEGKRQHEFARMVGLTQGRISQIAKRGTTDLATALRIQEATDHHVTIADLQMEDPKRQRAAKPTRSRRLANTPHNG